MDIYFGLFLNLRLPKKKDILSLAILWLRHQPPKSANPTKTLTHHYHM